jgi:hypothetical protein
MHATGRRLGAAARPSRGPGPDGEQTRRHWPDGGSGAGQGAVSRHRGSNPVAGAPRDPTSCRDRSPILAGGARHATGRSGPPRRAPQRCTRQGQGMPGATFETREWDVVSGPVPSSGESHVVWAGSHLRLVDDLRSMVAALPVAAFSVVAWSTCSPTRSSGLCRYPPFARCSPAVHSQMNGYSASGQSSRGAPSIRSVSTESTRRLSTARRQNSDDR